MNGNEYFDYLHETNGIYLANSLLSDFNGPNEKSFQVAYGLNMAEYGVPGLKFNIYQARGWASTALTTRVAATTACSRWTASTTMNTASVLLMPYRAVL